MNKRQKTSHRPQVTNSKSSNGERQRTTLQDKPSSKSSQPTISELFSATAKPIDHTAAAHQKTKLATDAPRHKRQKLEHPSSPASTTSEHLLPGSMYSFPSSRQRTNGANVVDLTKSPGGSPNGPLKKLPTRPRPNLHPELGAKRIVVKNLRTVPRTDPRQYFNATWEKLDKSLDAVFRGEKVPYSLEELYKGVENVCRQNHASELSGKLEARARDHATNSVKKSLLQGIAQSNVEVLRVVVAAWTTWVTQMDIIRSIFFYMDRAYLLPSKKLSLQEMGVSLFRDIVFNNNQLQPKIVGGVCDFIAADRNGDSSDQQLAKTAISMFNSLGVYTHVFEPQLLKESQTFVREWADQAVTTKDLATYLRDAVQLMQDEIKRCDVLGIDLKSTKRDLLALFETHLIERQQDYLRKSEIVTTDDNVADEE
jgi:cullin-4